MNIFKRILRKLRRQKASEEEISLYLCQKIRNGGGSVGENVDIIASNIDMGEPYLIKIGSNVTLTGVKLLTHDACLKKTVGYTRVGKVHIGDNVFVGWGSILLPNITIGSRVVIGAGSVVAKDIPDNSVVVGNPCKIIGTYDDLVAKTKDKMSKYPVVDLFPNEIMDNLEEKQKLIDSQFGYIR